METRLIRSADYSIAPFLFLAFLLLFSIIACETKAPKPEISVNPAGVEIKVTKGSNPDLARLTINNSGGDTLKWSIGDKPSWLTISPYASTGNNIDVTLKAQTDTMNTGTYTEKITIIAAEASNSPKSIPVSLTITEPASPPQTKPKQAENIPTTPSLSDVYIKVEEYYGLITAGMERPSSCCVVGTIQNNSKTYKMVNVTLPGYYELVEVADSISPGEEVQFVKCRLSCEGLTLKWRWESLDTEMSLKLDTRQPRIMPSH